MARILIMDDDDQLRNLLVRVLQREGHDVEDADNGRSGLELCGSFLPEVVVTDIVMPEQEGIETIMQLRRDYPDVPVIAMSGNSNYGSGEYLMVAEKLGAKRTLGKPFLPKDLIEAVDQALSSSVS